MSNLASTDETGHNPETLPHHQIGSQRPQNHNSLAYLSGILLEKSDSLIYAIVGICFFLGAVFTLGYTFWDFGNAISTISNDTATAAKAVVASAIITLISNLLLVLIIMEVLGTVIHYLKSHATSLRPFLFIGIISATRGILSIGARLSVEAVSTDEFYHSMIELGVNALAILALGITLRLLGKMADER